MADDVISRISHRRQSSIPRPISGLIRPRTASSSSVTRQLLESKEIPVSTPGSTALQQGRNSSPQNTERNVRRSSDLIAVYEQLTDKASTSFGHRSVTGTSHRPLSFFQAKDKAMISTPAVGRPWIPRSRTTTTISTTIPPAPHFPSRQPIGRPLPRSQTLHGLSCRSDGDNESRLVLGGRRDDNASHEVIEESQTGKAMPPSSYHRYSQLSLKNSPDRLTNARSSMPLNSFTRLRGPRKSSNAADIVAVAPAQEKITLAQARMRVRTSLTSSISAPLLETESSSSILSDDDPKLVRNAMPHQYWLGRLSSCLDRYRSEITADADEDAYEELGDVSRAMPELQAYCVNMEALDGFRIFQQRMRASKRGRSQDVGASHQISWPQTGYIRDKIITARLGPKHERKHSTSTATLPAVIGGQTVYLTLARPPPRPPPALPNLPRSKTMDSIRTVTSGFRRPAALSSESISSCTTEPRELMATAEGEEPRGRSRFSGGNRKASGTSTNTVGSAASGSSIRKRSADIFKSIVTDGPAKAWRFGRQFGASGSGSIDEMVASADKGDTWRESGSDGEDEVGLAK